MLFIRDLNIRIRLNMIYLERSLTIVYFVGLHGEIQAFFIVMLLES